MNEQVKETGKQPEDDILSSKEWWASQRRKYNKGLVTVKNIPNKYLFLTGWFLTGFSVLHLYPVLFSRKVRTVICVAVASVILAAAIVIAAFFCFIYLCNPDDKPFNYSEGRSFNQADWDRRDVYYDDRKYVVDDLMKNHLPQGMPYSKVTDLLGESSPCFPSKDSTTLHCRMKLKSCTGGQILTLTRPFTCTLYFPLRIPC
jgi:hypothetical protein